MSNFKTTTQKLKVIFFGSPGFVSPVLEQLSQKFTVVCVVTTPDKPIGRKQVLTPSPIKQYALENNLEVLTPEKLDSTFASQINKWQPDLIVVAAYGKIIPKIILDIPKYGCLNIHPSLLPKYRGASPIQAAILNGDNISGVTVIQMDEKMDHGPIISAKKIRLSNQDNFDSLSKKMFITGGDLLIEIIPDYVLGKIKPVVQKHYQAIYCHLLKKQDGYFDINNPPAPEKLYRMIRAYYPWPGVWTRWRNKIIKFLSDGSVQMEGKKSVKLADFLRIYPDFPKSEL